MTVQATSPQMVTGNGQSDTHALTISTRNGDAANPSPTAGQDYGTVTAKMIAAQAANPDSLPKMQAPWFIGSDYNGPDARSHEAQRLNGQFHVLPVDIDKGNHSLDHVTRITETIVGSETSYIVYSSSSATADNQKWRVLFFTSPAIPGVEYKETQSAIFDLYQMDGIVCDRALERTGQLIFLPNVPPEKRDSDGKPLFYAHHLNKGRTLKIEPDSRIYKRRQTVRAAVTTAAAEIEKRHAKAAAKRDLGDDATPVEIFNERHDLAALMLKYGYQQQGRSDHWNSPLQSSGSYAVRLFENRAWVSLSGSDLAAGVGAQKEHCCYGDAFDLFVHYEHQGDYTAAVRAYGREVDPPRVIDPAQPQDDALEADFGAPEAADTPTATSAVQDAPDAGNERLKKWVFLSGDNEFYHQATGQAMGVSAFNLAMAPHTGPVEIKTSNGPVEKKFPASKTLIEYLNGTVAHSTMYRPDCAGDLHIMSEGIPFINSYRVKSVPSADPAWEAKDAWRICQQHIMTILGDHGRIVIQWIAHNVQNPGMKILWAPIIVGVQGDGKTTLAKMLAAVMGKANVGPVSPEAMFSDFTGWAEGSCVKVLEEIRVHGNSRHDAMNKLKPLITNETVEIVRKGKDGKQVVNVTNYMALTNYMDALALDDGDRRWGVFRTKFESREDMLAEFDDAYWVALHSAIDTQPDVLRGWLLDVDLSDFNRVAAPDISEHKSAMILSTRSPDQVDVEEAIDLGWHGVTQTVLATDCLNEAIASLGGQRLATKRVSNALQAAGWISYPKPVFWKGRNRRVCFKKSARLGNATAAEIRSILDTSEGENDL